MTCLRQTYRKQANLFRAITEYSNKPWKNNFPLFNLLSTGPL